MSTPTATRSKRGRPRIYPNDEERNQAKVDRKRAARAKKRQLGDEPQDRNNAAAVQCVFVNDRAVQLRDNTSAQHTPFLGRMDAAVHAMATSPGSTHRSVREASASEDMRATAAGGDVNMTPDTAVRRSTRLCTEPHAVDALTGDDCHRLLQCLNTDHEAISVLQPIHVSEQAASQSAEHSQMEINLMPETSMVIILVRYRSLSHWALGIFRLNDKKLMVFDPRGDPERYAAILREFGQHHLLSDDRWTQCVLERDFAWPIERYGSTLTVAVAVAEMQTKGDRCPTLVDFWHALLSSMVLAHVPSTSHIQRKVSEPQSVGTSDDPREWPMQLQELRGKLGEVIAFDEECLLATKLLERAKRSNAKLMSSQEPQETLHRKSEWLEDFKSHAQHFGVSDDLSGLVETEVLETRRRLRVFESLSDHARRLQIGIEFCRHEAEVARSLRADWQGRQRKMEGQCDRLMKMLQRTMESEPTATIPRADQNFPSIIWVSTLSHEQADGRPIKSIDTGNSIEMDFASAKKQRGLPSCFIKARAMELQKKLGSELSLVGKVSLAVHQEVVTMTQLQELTNASVQLCGIRDSMHARLPHGDVVIIPFWQKYPTPEEALKIFDEIGRFHGSSETGDRLRLYPSREEFEASATKVDDINVLDEVAGLSNVNTFRPRTCFSSSDCRLTGRSVLKRTHSSGCQHVHVRPRAVDLKKLICHGGGDEGPYWFHQEHLDCFERNGEYRVIIATRRNIGRLRNRETYIVEIFKTFFDSNGVFSVIAMERFPDTSELYHDGSATRNVGELREFALTTCERLRERRDWKRLHESLEVGCRLDISIHKGEFFVNEIGRHWYSDWFSSYIEAPRLRICTAISTALADYFGSDAFSWR